MHGTQSDYMERTHMGAGDMELLLHEAASALDHPSPLGPHHAASGKDNEMNMQAPPAR